MIKGPIRSRPTNSLRSMACFSAAKKRACPCPNDHEGNLQAYPIAAVSRDRPTREAYEQAVRAQHCGRPLAAAVDDLGLHPLLAQHRELINWLTGAACQSAGHLRQLRLLLAILSTLLRSKTRRRPLVVSEAPILGQNFQQLIRRIQQTVHIVIGSARVKHAHTYGFPGSVIPRLARKSLVCCIASRNSGSVRIM